MSKKKTDVEYFIEHAHKLIGKTIRMVEYRKDWQGHVCEVSLICTDGASVEFTPQTQKGCPECDPDGCACDYLDAYSRKE